MRLFAHPREFLQRRLRQRAGLIVFTFMLFTNAFSICQVFPYAPTMVKHLGMTADERELGFYAGWVMTAYMSGNFLSAYPLGKLGDTHGRRPILLLGLLSNTLPQLAFGVSPSFGFALATRFLQGLPNALVGTAKAMVPDLVPPHEQGLAMSLLAGTWGMGNIVGPTLGAMLVERWPEDFPYLLPNAIGCALSLVAIVAVLQFLPGGRRQATTTSSTATSASSSTTSSSSLASADSAAEKPKEGESDESAAHDTTAEMAGAQLCETPSTEMIKEVEMQAVSTNQGGGAMSTPRHASPAAATASSDAAIPASHRLRPGESCRRPALVLSLYCLYALVDITLSEVVPLLCFAPPSSGGLGVDVAAVGAVLTATGVAILLFQVAVLPCLLARASPTWLLKASVLATIPMILLIPNVSTLPPLLTWPLFVSLVALSKAAAGAYFTCSFMLINASVAPSARGRVQGVAMMLVSVCRGVGPLVGSVTFAWSLTNELDVPGLGVRFIFLLNALLAALTCGVAFVGLDSSHNTPVGEHEAAS